MSINITVSLRAAEYSSNKYAAAIKQVDNYLLIDKADLPNCNDGDIVQISFKSISRKVSSNGTAAAGLIPAGLKLVKRLTSYEEVDFASLSTAAPEAPVTNDQPIEL